MTALVFRILLVLALVGALGALIVPQLERPVPPPSSDSLLWEEATAPRLAPTGELLARGEELYREKCEMCHGERGEGNGAGAYFLKTKPRNFARRIFKFRTTDGGMPADEDLFRSVTVGFEAYGMPSFRLLSIRDRWAVVHFVKHLAAEGTRRKYGDDEVEQRMQPGTPLALPPETAPGPGDHELGKTLFRKNCAPCHGPQGRGDGPAATDSMKDTWGNQIQPRDLGAGRAYRKTGWRTRDTARVIVLGIPGTPMPQTKLDSPRELWALARYVQVLSKERSAGE